MMKDVEEGPQMSTQADGEMVTVSLCTLQFRAVALESLSKSLGTNSSSQSKPWGKAKQTCRRLFQTKQGSMGEGAGELTMKCGFGDVVVALTLLSKRWVIFPPRQRGAMRGFGMKK